MSTDEVTTDKAYRPSMQPQGHSIVLVVTPAQSAAMPILIDCVLAIF